MEEEQKRLFFGAEVRAPWPSPLPQGRLVEEKSRHITLVFLGNATPPPLQDIPLPAFRLGPVATGSKIIFLPNPKVARVVACHLEGLDTLADYQKKLAAWLQVKDERPFLAHVTLARAPLDAHAWELFPLPLPAYIPAIHLYESHPNLTYKPLWSHSLELPFEEIEHTADIAYTIRGQTLTELQLHAAYALAFRFPPLLTLLSMLSSPASLDAIVAALNSLLSQLDMQMGTPFKAVSYHGEVKKEADGLLVWEMIVDV